MTSRDAPRTADGMRGSLAPLLRQLAGDLEPGVDAAVRARLQTSIAEAIAARTLEPVGQLSPGEKRALLATLDRALGRRPGRPDPRAVVDLTEELMTPLPGDRGPALATPAPAR